MKTRVVLSTLLLVLLAFSPLLSASEPEFKPPVAKLEFQAGDTIVFLGDSITHQCLYTQYVEDFFYTRFPGTRLKFHNSGVGGAKAWDALQRFDRDVAAYKPKYVTVLLGMNDGRYQPYDEETFQTYMHDMTEVIAHIEKIGATPVLMTPTMFDSRAARLRGRRGSLETLALYNSVLAYYGTWLREVAVENGYGFVDMYGPLNNLTLQQRKTEPKFTMIRDAVHPDPPGQLVMAYSIIDQLGLRGPVSNIRLVKGASGKFRAQTRGGTATDLAGNESRLSFTWQAESLPLVVPEEAQPGATLLRLGHRMSREALEVHGLTLKTGRYQLSIDGDVVGTYTAVQLARHVELQDNPKTPQHKQALEVAELNRQRNAGPVRSLRNEWRVFQQYSRQAAQLNDSPDDEKLRQQVEALKQRLEGMQQRIAAHEKEAKEIEDRIFEINRPQPHKYELTRVRAANARVSGRVTLHGQPLEGATIELHSTGGRAASGKTDAAGAFDLRGNGDAGAAAGAYRVTISRKGLPAKYADPAKTSLRVEIKPGDNEVNFDLTD